MNITKNIVNQPKSMAEIQISVPWADLAPKWDETLQKLGADLELPGFRKGQAPADMVEQRVAGQAQQQFLQTVMPQALMEALQGTNIVPIDYPKYQVNSFSKGQELKFTATVATRPAIQVGNYKGIKVIHPPLKQVTDEEVNKIIDDLYKRWKLRNPQGQKSEVRPQTSDSQNQGGGSLSFGDSNQPTTQLASDQPDDVFAKGVGAENLAD